MSEIKNGSQYPADDGIDQTENQKKSKNPELSESNANINSAPANNLQSGLGKLVPPMSKVSSTGDWPFLAPEQKNKMQRSAENNSQSASSFNLKVGPDSRDASGKKISQSNDFGRNAASIGKSSWTSTPETSKTLENLKQFSYGPFGSKNNQKSLGRGATSGSEGNNFSQGSSGSFTQGGFSGATGSSSMRPKPKNKLISRRAVGPQVTYEEIGLFPRSFSRVFDRFFKQIFSDVENLVIQEYRFYRYLFLTTIKTLCILFFVPFAVNFIAKTYLIRPITEYFWNTQQTEIFLNSYEQKRAFAELEEFEEKLYFESLLTSKNAIVSSPFLKASTYGPSLTRYSEHKLLDSNSNKVDAATKLEPDVESPQVTNQNQSIQLTSKPWGFTGNNWGPSVAGALDTSNKLNLGQSVALTLIPQPNWGTNNNLLNNQNIMAPNTSSTDFSRSTNGGAEKDQTLRALNAPAYRTPEADKLGSHTSVPLSETTLGQNKQFERSYVATWKGGPTELGPQVEQAPTLPETLGSLQDKILELGIRYNNHSIQAITNFFADFLSLITLLYLLVSFEIQINITKSFLLEVFFGLDDSKKSLLILIMTDLLVGYHSSNLWELFFQFIFNHYGIPESQTGIFLLVATLPVLLDVLFKYLIFRHLNRSSPATVATYHAIIE